MDVMSIASTATNMKTAYIQSEVSFKVMKMTLDISKQESAALMEIMDAAMTGIGENIDMLV